jgi:predicted lipoprotein with Yx(FWY)xxD motif
MKSLLLIAGVIAAVSLTVGLSAASASSHSTGTKVGLASTGLGRILVDGRGHTLYLFAKDTPGRSTCTGGCAAFWPPLIASGRPAATAGAKASLLGTTRRADGRLQVTYDRHPVYAFVKDVRRGQTNGEEINAFGGEWYALSPAGTKVERTSGMTSSTGVPAAGGYGY